MAKPELDALAPDPHDGGRLGERDHVGRTRLRILAALVALAAAGAAVWWFYGERLLAPSRAVPAHIKPGYVGITPFGRWRLICARVAPAMPAGPPQPPQPPQSNECRINHEVADRARAGQVIVAVNLGAAGAAKRRVVLIRLPPTAQAGDIALLRADDATRARVPVTVCSANECAAGGPITDEDWEELLDARSLQVVFPARNRQRVLVNVPADGLADAAHAMSVAQN